jgi:hypothetical protein
MCMLDNICMVNRHDYILINQMKNQCVWETYRSDMVRDADEASPHKRGAELPEWPQLHACTSWVVSTHARWTLPLITASAPNTSDRCDGRNHSPASRSASMHRLHRSGVFPFFIICNSFLVLIPKFTGAFQQTYGGHGTNLVGPVAHWWPCCFLPPIGRSLVVFVPLPQPLQPRPSTMGGRWRVPRSMTARIDRDEVSATEKEVEGAGRRRARPVE